MRGWVVVALGVACSCGGSARQSDSETIDESAVGATSVASAMLADRGLGEPALGEPPPGNPDAAGYVYLEELYEGLQSRWSSFLRNCRTQLPPDHALNQASLRAVLDIGIARNGKLRSVQVVEGSGNREFDDVATEVVRDAAPFPPPPASFVSDDGQAHVSWSFARDRRQAGLAGARLERVQWRAGRAVPMLLEAGMAAEAARRIAAAAEPLPADEAAGELVELNDTVALHVIAGALNAPEPALVRAAVEAAGRGRVAAASGRLGELATSGAGATLRLAAINALAQLAGPAALAALETVVAREQATDAERIAAAAGLAATERADTVVLVALALVEQEAPDRQALGLAMLGHVPAEGQLAQLERLAGPGSIAAVRAAALGAIARVAATDGAPARRASRALLRAFAAKDATLRVAIADAIALATSYGYDQRVAYWKIVELLDDRDERVRAAAVRAGAALGRQRFAREIVRLRKESSPAVLLALAAALAVVDDARAVEKLTALAARDEPGLRLAAVRSLATLGKRDALEPFAAASSAELRAAAIAGRDELAVVEAALKDDAIEVQAAALSRLGTLRGRLGALPGAAGLLATSDRRARVAIAGAWLATRPNAGRP